jgi:hypothetical protein
MFKQLAIFYTELQRREEQSRSCSLLPKMRKHALHFPVPFLRAGCLLISTDPSLAYSEAASCVPASKYSVCSDYLLL